MYKVPLYKVALFTVHIPTFTLLAILRLRAARPPFAAEMLNPYAAAASNVNVTRRQQTSLSHLLSRRDVVPPQANDGDLLVTAPRAQRRTPRAIANSPAVRRMVKMVEPVDTELHPRPRLWTLKYGQNMLLANNRLLRGVCSPNSYPVSMSHFDLAGRFGCYPTIESNSGQVETLTSLRGTCNTGSLHQASLAITKEVL